MRKITGLHKTYHRMIKRGKQKIETHYGMKDFYNYYKKNTENPISYADFTSLHQEINESIVTSVIEQNYIHTFPCKVGKLRIKKYKAKIKVHDDGTFEWKALKIDYQKTWKYWREKYPEKTDQEILTIPNKARVYHMNQHTNGYRYKYVWDKSVAIFKGKSVVTFKPVRTVSRALAAWLKSIQSINIDYFE